MTKKENQFNFFYKSRKKWNDFIKGFNLKLNRK